MEIRTILDKTEKRNITGKILKDLPEWFAIEEYIEDYIDDSEEETFLAAFVNAEAVGFFYLSETGKQTAEIHVMGVLKDFQAQGIGKRLTKEACRVASEQGYEFLQVKTVKSGHYEEYDRTNAFYQSQGFREFEVFSELWDSWNPCQVYVMSLAREGSC